MANAAPHFSRKFIQAVNDWQSGSIGKKKKAKRLLRELNKLTPEPYLRECNDACYRAAVLEKAAVSHLFFHFFLSEETSSWTIRRQDAARFKDGPSKLAIPTVIFEHRPKPSEVVLNLDSLYNHPQFAKSCDHWEGEGLNISNGIKRYHNNQHEVILNIDRVPHSEIFAFGSNASLDIADGNMHGVHVIDKAKKSPQAVERSFADADLPVRRYVFGESVPRIYRNWLNRAEKRIAALTP